MNLLFDVFIYCEKAIIGNILIIFDISLILSRKADIYSR